MLIAKKLKEDNIAEYLLYMWQVEDIIRANELDIEKIQQQVIDRFDQPDDVKQEIREWYENLIEMMRREGKSEKGHLLINQNIISELSELHMKLLSAADEKEYLSLYYKTLPIIVELRAKSQDKDSLELETCFSALYGYLLMKLQRKEISNDTQAAILQISSLLKLLSEKYKEDRVGMLDLN